MRKEKHLNYRNSVNKKTTAAQFKIITPIGINPYPNNFEEAVARILARKFQSDVAFVQPTSSLHTPDLQIIKTSEFWEIKNIRGNGKNTIEDNLKKAAKQSNNVVISLFRTKMSSTQATARIHYFLSRPHGKIEQIILVTKSGKTIDFYS